MMSNSKRLSVSESSLLNDSTSSESSGSEDSHDEQISDEEDKSALSVRIVLKKPLTVS